MGILAIESKSECRQDDPTHITVRMSLEADESRGQDGHCHECVIGAPPSSVRPTRRERDTVIPMRRSLIPVVMFVLGALSVLAWQWTSRGPASDEQPQTARTLRKPRTVAQAPAAPVQAEDTSSTSDASI